MKPSKTAMREAAVYVVILWSVVGSAVVSGQCTTSGCGVEYRSNDRRNLGAFDADDDIEYRSELDELKLQIQVVNDELGKLLI